MSAKAPQTPLEQARLAFLLMLGAGLMFMLAGVIPMVMALMRDQDIPAVNAAFVAIGGAFIAIASANYAAAKKKLQDGDRGEGRR